MEQFSLYHRVRPAQGPGPGPALILLHGFGSNETDLLALSGSMDPGLLVVSVRAPFVQAPGYMWYDFAEGMGLGGSGIERSLNLLRAFLSEVVRAYDIDPGRVYTGGFSQGAAMAGTLGLLEADRVAGSLMVSGYLPPGIEERYRPPAAAGHPFFQAHGTQDMVVPLAAAHRTRDFLRQTPVELTYREYPIGHEVSPDELADIAGWLGRTVMPATDDQQSGARG